MKFKKTLPIMKKFHKYINILTINNTKNIFSLVMHKVDGISIYFLSFIGIFYAIEIFNIII